MRVDQSEEFGIFLAHEELRESQGEMIVDGIAALGAGGFLLASAPTGIGKTAAALAAALDASRKSPNPRVVMFLTGRQSQHRIVVDTVRRINENIDENSKVRLVDLIGQQGMCINEIKHEHRALFSRLCADKRGSRTCRPWLADSELIRPRILQDPLHVDELVSICEGRDDELPHGICPWKVARESASFADIVVCDYNHVFVEPVRNSSLSAMGLDLEDMILVVDEAHNLPDRIRRGFERRITMKVIRDAIYEIEEHTETIQSKGADLEGEESDANNTELDRLRRAEAVMRRLREGLPRWFAEIEGGIAGSVGEDQRVSMTDFVQRVSDILAEDVERAVETDSLVRMLQTIRVEVDETDEDMEEETACMRLAILLQTCMQNHDNPAFALVHDKIGGEEHRLTTHLLDPGVVSGDLLSMCSGAIMMSGTLSPPKMYGDLLKIPLDRVSIIKEYTSHFLSERRPVLIAKDVTSKYQDRGEENTARLRAHIHSVLKQTPGHVAVFAPSYALLEQILIEDEDWIVKSRRMLQERPGASKEEMDRMVDIMHRLRREGTPAILSGVLGGKLAEGVDYPGNILDAVICIGLPLPPPSSRQDALRSYFEERYGKQTAWRYAGSQPAINRLLQAMGRPIRKAADRALVVLLEKRLLQRGYKFCLPEGMHMVESVDSGRTERHAERFFRNNPDPAKHIE
tara:strand:- start:12494 stop:14560 length:2067 start_codon:yes stop_codon:yes gene_type:complete